MLVGMGGEAVNLAPGDEADFPSDEAIRFIEAGFAVPVAEQKMERAVKKLVAKEKRN